MSAFGTPANWRKAVSVRTATASKWPILKLRYLCETRRVTPEPCLNLDVSNGSYLSLR